MVSSAGAAAAAGYYPYIQFGQGGGGAAAAYAQGQGYGMQFPQMFHYSAVTATAGVAGFASQLYGGVPISLAPSPTAQAGLPNCLPHALSAFFQLRGVLISFAVSFAIKQA